ncbi:hypothetical protein [Streptomyces sp. NPDC058297]|uniref:hypothetical protein n=1 Tax=Streptomyces sp. NPDC058297 TaxID=3346433 RepID=UPI0036EC3DF2
MHDRTAVMATPAREPHYTKIPEWVSECGANGMEAAVYQHLAKRLHHASGSRKVDPSRARLAADIGLKKPDDVDPYLRALEALGTIIIQAKKGVRTTYELPVWPPEGYDGPENTHAADKWQKDDAAGYKAWRARRRALVDAAEAPYAEKKRARVVKSRARKTAVAESDVPVATGRSEQNHVPVATGRYQPVPTGTHRPVATGTNQDDQNDQTNMGDGRQANTGSRGDGGGGSAASGKANPPSEKAKTADLRTVIEGIPGLLAKILEEDWPRGLPTKVNDLISKVLLEEFRTAGEVVQRMERRWGVFGYEDALLSQDGPGLYKPLGVLEELLSASKCGGNYIDCEDGVDRYTGALCPRCEDFLAERRGPAAGEEKPVERPQVDASRPQLVRVPKPMPSPSGGGEAAMTREVQAAQAMAARAALRQRPRVPR